MDDTTMIVMVLVFLRLCGSRTRKKGRWHKTHMAGTRARRGSSADQRNTPRNITTKHHPDSNAVAS
jgi:hypothetical protein